MFFSNPCTVAFPFLRNTYRVRNIRKNKALMTDLMDNLSIEQTFYSSPYSCFFWTHDTLKNYHKLQIVSWLKLFTVACKLKMKYYILISFFLQGNVECPWKCFTTLQRSCTHSTCNFEWRYIYWCHNNGSQTISVSFFAYSHVT